MISEPIQSYITRGEPYQGLGNFIKDGMFAAGDAFNPNSLYNTYKLFVPQRFVFGNLDMSKNSRGLYLFQDQIIFDASYKTLAQYKKWLEKGELKIIKEGLLTQKDIEQLIKEMMAVSMDSSRVTEHSHSLKVDSKLKTESVHISFPW